MKKLLTITMLLLVMSLGYAEDIEEVHRYNAYAEGIKHGYILQMKLEGATPDEKKLKLWEMTSHPDQKRDFENPKYKEWATNGIEDGMKNALEELGKIHR